MILTSSNITFYAETSPEPSEDYFFTVDYDGKKIQPSKIATVTVFYNEEGYTMEKTMRCLNNQQNISNYGQDLLMVGDGVELMSESMTEYLQKVVVDVISTKFGMKDFSNFGKFEGIWWYCF